MSSAYRSAYDHVVGLKLAATEDAHAQLDPLMPGLRRIAGRRMARMTAGVVGIVGGLAMIVFAIMLDRDGMTTYSLLGASAAMLATWVLSRSVLGVVRRFEKTGSVKLALSGILEADLAAIDASDPRTELRQIEARLADTEGPSIWLPATGVAMLVPLLLHFFVWAAMNWNGVGRSIEVRAQDYDEWIRISLVIVGHAHIALIVLCILFAKKIRKLTTEQLAQVKIHREWAKIWLIVIGISCMPGIILYLVPPIIVALTGLAVIPFIITLLYKAVLKERTELAFAEAATHAAPGLAEVVAPVVWLAKEQEREPGRDDEDPEREADDGSEREAGFFTAHRIGNDGARR